MKYYIKHPLLLYHNVIVYLLLNFTNVCDFPNAESSIGESKLHVPIQQIANTLTLLVYSVITIILLAHAQIT